MFSKKVTKIGRNLTVFFEVLVQVILLKLVSNSHQFLEKNDFAKSDDFVY